MAKAIPTEARTIGQLRATGYEVVSIREEMRRNLIQKIRDGRDAVPRHLRLRGDRSAADRERHPRRAGHHLPRRARPGEDAHRAQPDQPARRSDPGHRRVGDQRRPLQPDLQVCARPRRRARRRHGDRLAAARSPLRREAGDPGHDDRRPDRRGRPDQGRRGPLSLGRTDDLTTG